MERRSHLPGSLTQTFLDLLSQLSNLTDEEIAESGEVKSGTSRGSLIELADGPVSRLQGITPRQARALRETLRTRTIRELAVNRFFKLARAIVALADLEANQDSR